MKTIKSRVVAIIFLLTLTGIPGFLQAQKHHAAGEQVIRGNRLISAKSGPGKILYQQSGGEVDQFEISVDGTMSESEWKEAQVITPFKDREGRTDSVSVRVIHDQEKIGLFWEVEEVGGIDAGLREADGLITGDDYIRIDLKPWLPDDILHGRDYHYSIAVNPAGIIWDAYFDPYLDGFFFSSWDSGTETGVVREQDSWKLEMVIPFSGLDVYSDPGWKWSLDFYHRSLLDPGLDRISSGSVGVTVAQGVMVRRPGLVSYYWPRPDFMTEIKPDMSLSREQVVEVTLLPEIPAVDGELSPSLWESVPVMKINRDDRMGEEIESQGASFRLGMSPTHIFLALEAEGAKTDKRDGSGSTLGEGMAAQMSGVNGVFVDQAIFEEECFWIILQPRGEGADEVHEDYYHIIVDNHGEIRGTHYDSFGAPVNDWNPTAEIDLFDTEQGWGAEVAIDLASFDLPVSPARNWGLNVFRNRLPAGGGNELQAWRFTGNNYLNPKFFGRITGVPGVGYAARAAVLQRRRQELKEESLPAESRLRAEFDRVGELLRESGSEEMGVLLEAEKLLEGIDQAVGAAAAGEHYRSVAHPVEGGYPLMDICFIGEFGWAVGAMGTILRTEDGGETWAGVEIPTDYDFYRVDFVDRLRGWAVGGRIRIAETNEAMRHDRRGGFGTVWATEDGGKTWHCQYGERGRLLFGLDFLNRETGYACGERGILLKTEDGGRHWRELKTTGTMNWLYGISFIDPENGFAVGMRETVLRTSDGGVSWTALEASADRRPYGFQVIYRDVSFSGETGCIVGQNGSVLVSHDQGESWEPSATFFKDEIRDLIDLRRVRLVSPTRGFAAGELGTRILVTEDGGRSWALRPMPDTEWLRAVWADRTGKVVVAGEREKIAVSLDQGYNWEVKRGDRPRADILVLLAHGDDAPINLNAFFAHYAINEGKTIVEAGVMSDTHSSEYEETYNLEHDRNMWMVGVRTTTNFNEFETGNNGSDYYHFNERLWEGEENVVRHMVAAIRAYRPDIVITHGGVFGDYDKPGHKLSGRAGLPAFETAGGSRDHWPELTRLGLEPWQPKKLYVLASESYPETLELSAVARQPLRGTDGDALEFGEYVIRNFQSQGVYHARIGRLSLVKSTVPVPSKEISVFDGIRE